MAALADCGTHAIVAAAIEKDGEGEETPTRCVLSGGAVGPGMLVLADAGLYSFEDFRMVADAGADALSRVGANVGLPLLEWFPDGSYLSFIAEPAEKARNSYRLRHGLEAELVFDELKTHQRGAGAILRSRKPELIEQEIQGLLLAHYGIRYLLREAAEQAELDPRFRCFRGKTAR
jgi:hypothetical protein